MIFFAGLKGKLTNTVSYNVKASYVNERNKACFEAMIMQQMPIMLMGISSVMLTLVFLWGAKSRFF
jgi:hypothetical protein